MPGDNTVPADSTRPVHDDSAAPRPGDPVPFDLSCRISWAAPPATAAAAAALAETRRLPRSKNATATGSCSRGLLLVASLTECWGTRYHATGKTIWAEQTLPHA
ncbi:hypothetical protein QFZ82_007254 [Streptomyces sp. V4I23]|uniref:hypothetical protein n=1 Tax=Streptomyces sp. V4I23 TaxID=3042282 RepID=UPI002788FC9A|nr:hypothetical protein [Streptomyces sp. V4I23]MDQ1012769.1 hypothetical protein [Streptomyces sp. V4I23]